MPARRSHTNTYFRFYRFPLRLGFRRIARAQEPYAVYAPPLRFKKGHEYDIYIYVRWSTVVVVVYEDAVDENAPRENYYA